MLKRTFPSPEALRRFPFGLADFAVILGTLLLLGLIARVGSGMLVSFVPPDTIPAIDMHPRHLPYYAARSTLRMFIGLFFSTIFTFIIGYIAAHSRRAEQLIIPMLDILQSVPVLGFLSITVTGFIALFPGNLLGLEAAAIFAIFTSQVWNMTFSFYQSLKSISPELEEAARLYRLSGWQRFIKLELPSAMIGLVWNAMMSFGGGWFFVVESEAISVLNKDYKLPGLGSYVAGAIAIENLNAIGLAILTILIVILLCDQLFWRPVVAWSSKFRQEQSAATEAPRSWLLALLKNSRIPSHLHKTLTPFHETTNRVLSALTPPRSFHTVNPVRQETGDRLFHLVLLLCVGAILAIGLQFILSTVGMGEVFTAFRLGCLTLLRVLLLLLIATLVWTPIGVAIGFNPRLTRLLQPVVQFLASFPANFIFPFATVFFIRTGVSIDWGSTLLMAMGAQWYILFNTIAGAMSIPSDLREMAVNMGVRGWHLWQKLIIPGIFSAWVTGAITASGGAWNASIVAEVVTWGATTLQAEGLGAYIAQATAAGDWSRITLGIGMMSLFVVGINRLFWRRLYEIGETKYRL